MKTQETMTAPVDAVVQQRIDGRCLLRECVSRLLQVVENEHSCVHDRFGLADDIADLCRFAMAMRAACEDVALTIEHTHGDNVGFADADILRSAIQGMFPPNYAPSKVGVGDCVRLLFDVISDEDGEVFGKRGEVLVVQRINEESRYAIKVSSNGRIFGVESYEVEVC